MPARIRPRRPFRLYIAEWRTHRGLTQQELADRLGTSDVTVSRWETGKRRPDPDAQAAIAEALDAEPEDLFRHPSTPSVDALLRDQPPAVWEETIEHVEIIKRRIGRR